MNEEQIRALVRDEIQKAVQDLIKRIPDIVKIDVQRRG